MKEGDVVRLRSGGPYMTLLNAVAPEGTLLCAWFSLAGEYQTVYVPSAALITYDELTGAARSADEQAAFADEEAPPAPAQTWKQKRGLT